MVDGAHRRGRTLKDVVVGSKQDAAEQRKLAQRGAAAAGRRGQAVQLARAQATAQQDAAIDKEVTRAMKQGTGLVQAALEHWRRRSARGIGS